MKHLTWPLNPDLAAGIRRVKGAKRLGMRLGNWLTIEQSRKLLSIPDSSTKDKRDRAILSLLLGCGLRRAELTGLRLTDFQWRDEPHFSASSLCARTWSTKALYLGLLLRRFQWQRRYILIPNYLVELSYILRFDLF